MATQRLRPVLVNELLNTIFAGSADELQGCCARWCDSSPRFAVFLATYRDKIRKKLRAATDEEGLRDLRAELLAAASLLSERAFTLEYEKYAASKTRGPDFSILFKTHTPFNVEVKRIRGQTQSAKWADVLCNKLGQLPPGVINALVVYHEPTGQRAPFDPRAAMAQLRAEAERKDEEFFTRRGLEGSRAYLRQVPKLSVVALRAGTAAGGAPLLTSWINPQARHPLSPELASALLRSLEAL